MNWPLFRVLLLFGLAIFMFMRDKLGMNAVSLIMMAALPFTGLITVPECLMAFSDPNCIPIIFLFVLSEGPRVHWHRSPRRRLDQSQSRRQFQPAPHFVHD